MGAELVGRKGPGRDRGLPPLLLPGLLAAILGVAWMLRPAPRPPARTPLPIGPEPLPAEPGFKSPFPGDLPGDLERELAGLAEQAVGPGGARTALVDGKPPAGMARALDPDPLSWGRIVAALPALGRFDAWIAAGGRPEGLDPALLRRLGEVDRAFRERDLPRPLAAFLEASPSPEAVERDALLPPEASGAAWLLPARTTGWPAVLLRRFAAAVGALGAATDSLGSERAWREGGTPPPRPRGYPVQLGLKFTDFLGLCWQDDAVRPAAALWIRPAAESLVAMVYAAARGIRDEPAQGDALALATGAMYNRLDPLWLDAPSFGPPERLTGLAPAVGAEWYLRAATYRHVARARARLGRVDPGLEAALREALRNALEPSGPGGPVAVLRRATAARDLADRMVEVGDWGGLGVVYRSQRGWLLAEEGSRPQVELLAHVARAWVDGLDPVAPGPDEIEELAGALRLGEEHWDNEKDQERIGPLLEELIRRLR